MKRIKLVAAGITAVAVASLFSLGADAYVLQGKWASTPVLFYINPQNADVSADAAEAALRSSMDVWSNSSGSGFRYLYVGRVNDTTTGYDNRNVVIFRPDGDGSTIARAYTWSYGTTIVDADIIFYDGAFTFFTGTSGCNSNTSYGAYIEDIAVHEFGHALGLLHTSVEGATMFSGYAACTQDARTLEADDRAGAQALYPGSAPAANTAPAVSISSPANYASFAANSSLSFSGSASDQQDGNVSSRLSWHSNIAGYLGSGASVTTVLGPGTHVVTASVTDNGGLSGSAQVTVTINDAASAPPPSGSASLSARGWKAKGGLQKVDLSWNGLAGTASVDVYRNAGKVMSTPNDGAQTDSIDKKGSGTYRYRVCAAGTSTCSNEVMVTF